MWISRIFLYAFVLLAIAGLLNVAIFLIEGCFYLCFVARLTVGTDAFHEAKGLTWERGFVVVFSGWTQCSIEEEERRPRVTR